jgi:hypothetical protein
MAFSNLDQLLEAKTESEFFIRMCALLPDHRIGEIKCSTELLTLLHPPALELTFFMVLPHVDGQNIGYARDKVWVFTLYADGRLFWQIAHYEKTSPKGLTKLTDTQIQGLQAIQDYLRETKGDISSRLFSAPAA